MKKKQKKPYEFDEMQSISYWLGFAEAAYSHLEHLRKQKRTFEVNKGIMLAESSIRESIHRLTALDADLDDITRLMDWVDY